MTRTAQVELRSGRVEVPAGCMKLASMVALQDGGSTGIMGTKM